MKRALIRMVGVFIIGVITYLILMERIHNWPMPFTH